MNIFLLFFCITVSANSFTCTTSNDWMNPYCWSLQHTPLQNETVHIYNHTIVLNSNLPQYVKAISMHNANVVLSSPLHVNTSLSALNTSLSIQSVLKLDLFYMSTTHIWLFNNAQIVSKKPMLLYDNSFLYLASNAGDLYINSTFINSGTLVLYSGSILFTDTFIQKGKTIVVPGVKLVPPTLIRADKMNISGTISIFSSYPLHYFMPLFSANSISYDATFKTEIPARLLIYPNIIGVIFDYKSI